MTDRPLTPESEALMRRLRLGPGWEPSFRAIEEAARAEALADADAVAVEHYRVCRQPITVERLAAALAVMAHETKLCKDVGRWHSVAHGVGSEDEADRITMATSILAAMATDTEAGCTLCGDGHRHPGPSEHWATQYHGQPAPAPEPVSVEACGWCRMPEDVTQHASGHDHEPESNGRHRFRHAVQWDIRGGRVWLSREQWGDVIDGLVMLRAGADARKAANPESTSDVRSAEIAAILAALGEAAPWPSRTSARP